MKKQSLNLSSFVTIILFIFSFAYSSEKNIAIGKASIIDGESKSDKVLEIIEKVAVKYSDASVSKSYLKAMENQAKKRSAVILNPIDYISWDHSKL